MIDREKLEKYYNEIVKNSRNDLKNPRISFNWGYHDCISDGEMNQVRDISDHFDPYYMAGYNSAKDSLKLCIKPSSDSDFNWHKFTEELSDGLYRILAKSVLESIILGKEYLFHKKESRKDFKSWQWSDIIGYYYSCMYANTSEKLSIMHSVLTEMMEKD